MAENDWKDAGAGNVWDFKSEGDGAVFQGIYMSREENVGENNSNLYTFKDNKGELVSIWGTSLLDIRFKNLQFGEEVKITYKGEMPSEKRKGKTYHLFEVLHRMPVFENDEPEE